MTKKPTPKNIGLLTSGGDCAGLNAVLRAVVHRASMGYGWDVYGIKQGILGLLQRPVDIIKLDAHTMDGHLLRSAGTILGTTNKSNPFTFNMSDGSKKNRSHEATEGYNLAKFDALIAVGGDGSLNIMRTIAQQGSLNLIGIPKTIDNDLGLTEKSVGFDTAVAVATEALDRLQPTAASHSRVMILEVMGRDAGHIALAAGIAGGADIILIPEIPYHLEVIAQKIQSLKEQGRNFALVIVAEAVTTIEGEAVTTPHQDFSYGGIGHYIRDKIEEATGAETRVTVLGHVQRGGIPIASDRILASAFGVHAVDLIAQNKFDRMVAWQNRTVTDVPLEKAIADYRMVNPLDSLVKTARGLGICLGDA